MAVLVVQDARKADLPLVAVATELRIQAQTAAIQVLKAADALPKTHSGQRTSCVSGTGTYHEGFGPWSRQAGKRLSQESCDFQKQLAGGHLQRKGATAFCRIDGVFVARADAGKHNVVKIAEQLPQSLPEEDLLSSK